jgi:hypothetical protein
VARATPAAASRLSLQTTPHRLGDREDVAPERVGEQRRGRFVPRQDGGDDEEVPGPLAVVALWGIGALIVAVRRFRLKAEPDEPTSLAQLGRQRRASQES